ncbi:HupE/UreJ family protein, partial [Agromyces sp. NPDC055520]
RGPLTRVAAAIATTLFAIGVGAALPAGSAFAHDATTAASASVERAEGRVSVELQLEYDLLMKSAWLYATAYEATDPDEQRAQLAANADAVDEYVVERFAIDADGERCSLERAAPSGIRDDAGRSYAVLVYSADCPGPGPGADGGAAAALAASSALFPDVEGFVHDTQTLVTWNVDGVAGSGLLTTAAPTIALGASAPNLVEFFLLGAEHLLLGLDHLLFLFALLLGARSLRGIVMTATTFTVAHSVTFLVAGMGFVSVPAAIVEPVIAVSIAAAAAAVFFRREVPARYRMPVVFAFGLLHGLGFASALGIDEQWSWGLLGSLLAFNVGIEIVQLVLIAVAFPLLVLLRRTAIADPSTRVAAALVAAVGLFWFGERIVAQF